MINKQQFIELLQTTSENRRAYFATDFFAWWFYYFSENFVAPLAKFHFDWIDILENSELNVLIEGFRGSIKTSIVVAYITWCVCYKKHSFIVWQSFGSDSSQRMTKQIAINLMNERLEADYGVLFHPIGSREDMEKKSIGDFDTKNGIKILATSLGEKLRGAISRNSRPDLLILDDIDVTDSVRNPEIISKNYEKITGETIGAMSKNKNRIIFLGNVINEDGVVPRFKKEKSQDPNWRVFSQPIYNDDGSIAWSYFTEGMIEKIKSNEGEIAFGQNYLLIPRSSYENGIIKEEYLRWYEQVNLEDFDELFMHADTTHTGKSTSDYFCAVILGLSKRDNNFYIIDFYLDKVDVETQARVVINFYLRFGKKIKKMTYDEKSNNGFGMWTKKLAKDEYKISLPLEDLKFPNDKVTHFEPHIPHFKANRVYLPINHKDIEIAKTQLLAFPNSKVNDDFVDGISGVLDNFPVFSEEPQIRFI